MADETQLCVRDTVLYKYVQYKLVWVPIESRVRTRSFFCMKLPLFSCYYDTAVDR